MLNNEQTNILLTLFMEKEWHDNSYADPNEYKENPDFSTPNDFDRLRKWMEGNEGELWEAYLKSITFTIGKKYIRENNFNTIILNAQLNPSNLVRFLVEQRKEWGYTECPSNCKGDDCINWTEQSGWFGCSTSYRKQHPAAEYLNSIK